MKVALKDLRVRSIWLYRTVIKPFEKVELFSKKIASIVFQDIFIFVLLSGILYFPILYFNLIVTTSPYLSTAAQLA